MKARPTPQGQGSAFFVDRLLRDGLAILRQYFSELWLLEPAAQRAEI